MEYDFWVRHGPNSWKVQVDLQTDSEGMVLQCNILKTLMHSQFNFKA